MIMFVFSSLLHAVIGTSTHMIVFGGVRFGSLLHIFLNSYQSERASEAISNGGFFGQGIGEGTLNSKVPEAHTDYIISVISEEFGVIIVLVIIAIFLIFSYNIIKKINKENDDKVKLTLIGIVTIILFQTFIHIGVNIRLLPTTGMTLPFLSYGGSSTISASILSGIILNLTRRKISQWKIK